MWACAPVQPFWWWLCGRRTSIDKAGRVVIPKELRDRVGITAGPIEVQVDGSGLRIDPVAAGAVEEKAGRLVVAAGGAPLVAAAVEHSLVLATRDGRARNVYRTLGVRTWMLR